MMTAKIVQAAAEEYGYTIPTDPQTLNTHVRVAVRLIDMYLRQCTKSDIPHSVLEEVTACQVAFWHATGITTPGMDFQTGGVVYSASLNGGSVTYAGADKAAEQRKHAAVSLCFEARVILESAGFRPRPLRVVG